MPEQNREQATCMLRAAAGGDRQAAAELLPLVYDELRRLARARMARLAPGQTTRPTSLVHEAYLKLVGKDDGWSGQAHFFAAAAQAMRQILVDQARRKAALKRGGKRALADGGRRRLNPKSDAPMVEVDADGGDLAIAAPSKDLVALDDALQELELRDPRKAQVVTMRFFGGMSVEDIAAALDISTATVKRDWRFARAVLLDELSEGDADALR